VIRLDELPKEGPTLLDQDRVREHARSYTEAWCSRDPARVASHFVPGGTIAINGREPTEITEVARAFIEAFPDINVYMDDVVFKDETVEYHWTFTGTSSETGNSVRVSGFEKWTLGDEGLVVESQGNYDQAEYDRQLEHGAA
jgi:nuclear transport factor 2 (NTF2) superfamily protein